MLVPRALVASRLARTGNLDNAFNSLPADSPGWLAHLHPRSTGEAVRRACRIAGLLYGLDTCLTRSLLLASLLRRHHPTLLHIGFFGDLQGTERVRGHAWVTVNGINVSDARDQFIVQGAHVYRVSATSFQRLTDYDGSCKAGF
jgi:hypothetical protein